MLKVNEVESIAKDFGCELYANKTYYGIRFIGGYRVLMQIYTDQCNQITRVALQKQALDSDIVQYAGSDGYTEHGTHERYYDVLDIDVRLIVDYLVNCKQVFNKEANNANFYR